METEINQEEEFNAERVVCSDQDEEEKTSPAVRKTLSDLLSDVGKFSLCGLCSCLLAELYGEQSRSFCLTYVKNLVAHLNLPENLNCTFEAIITEDSGTSLEIFAPSVVKDCCEDPTLILQELVYFSIKDGIYDARSRILIYSVASFLQVSGEDLEEYEEGALSCLKQEISTITEEQEAANKQKARKKKIRRRVLIAAASIGGGVLIGLTGGLAVPLLATGAAAIVGGASAAVIGSVAGTAVIGSLFGIAGAGLTGMKMKKRVGEVEEFAFEDLTEGNQLHLTVAISGWLKDETPSAFRAPWESLYLSKEQYCLRYESKYLLDLGSALDHMATTALTMVAAEALKTTVLAGLLAALAAPAVILQLASIIDNPWCVCIKRSAEVGQVLAQTLLSRQHGMRPVSLIGYSFGARVILCCLQEMLKQKPEFYEGIIENVILLGAPVSAAEEEWASIDKVVHGKIINGYSSGDWILKFMFRASEAKMNIAGLQPVLWKNRRLTNVDLSDIVTGHLDYSHKITEILKVLGIRCRTNVWKQTTMIKKSRRNLSNAKSTKKSDQAYVEQSEDPVDDMIQF